MAQKEIKQQKIMETLIINILKQYKECTSLSEGNYAYMIEGDDETLRDIARQIQKELEQENHL